MFDPRELLNAPARQATTLRETAHRPWPVPPGSWLMAQTWEDLLFAHWEMPIDRLRAHLPPELEVDTHDGRSYVGITPFRVTNLRLRGTPPVPLPGVSSFLELNCRTYVRHAGERPGIWFFSLDASSRLAVEGARRTYKLPYFHARMEGLPRYRCARNDAERPHVWEAHYEPVGRTFNAEEGTLEHFLTERYCLYTTDEAGALWRADIHHPPWPLQEARAEIELNTMPPDGIDTYGEPLLHFSRRQDVLIWPLERVSPQ
ncbi:MAG TPA: DUF2071 domain-containing protein [Gaiellaceae bacterium]|nr:DUF2071 domain-containing protein [Gaiellaceae bacterium]